MAPIVLAFMTAVLAASFFLWSRAVGKWRSGEPLLPAALHQPPPWDLLDMGIAVGCWLVFNVVAMFVIQGLLHLPATDLETLGVDDQKTALIVMEVTSLATCAAVALVFRFRHKLSLRDLGWDARYLFSDVLLGVKAFIMLLPIVYGLQFILTQLVDSKHPLIEMLKESPDPGFFAVAAFAAVIAAPITEEFFFRVVLQGWLERLFWQQQKASDNPQEGISLAASSPVNAQVSDNERPILAEIVDSPTEASDSNSFQTTEGPSSPFKTPDLEPAKPHPSFWPIAASSLVFAVAHWSHGPDPIPLFVFAVGLGYLYQRTNRILPGIILHLLLNLCSLIALGLSITE